MHVHTIQLNIEKVLGGTSHMDATEFGAYMSLIICAYQQKNKLPDDNPRLARMAKCTPKVWMRVREVVASKFHISGGFWAHLVVAEELSKYSSLSTKNKSNSLKRWKKKMPVGKIRQSDRNANTNNNNQITIDKDTNVSLLPREKNKISLDELSIDSIRPWLAEKRALGRYLTIDEERLLEMFKDYVRSNNRKYKDIVAAFRNAFEWNNAPRKGHNHGNGKFTAEDARRKVLASHGITED